jgi:hypothetical protein
MTWHQKGQVRERSAVDDYRSNESNYLVLWLLP